MKKRNCTNCLSLGGERCTNIDSSYFAEKVNNKTFCLAYKQNGELAKSSVEHPEHYNKGIEAIDIIESWNLNFSLGNAIKYILRAPHKGKEVEDLEKARWYINRELERLKK